MHKLPTGDATELDNLAGWNSFQLALDMQNRREPGNDCFPVPFPETPTFADTVLEDRDTDYWANSEFNPRSVITKLERCLS